MVKQLYSDFDASIVIRSAKGKTFDEKTFPYKALSSKEISSYSKAIEEIVILKHQQKWSNATLYGVESSFLTMSHLDSHLVEGKAVLKDGEYPLALAGAGLLEKLQAYIRSENGDYELLEIYFPRRDAKMKLGSTPFNNEHVRLGAAYNFNRDVNLESIVVPLDFAQKKLEYENDISCIYVHVPNEKKISKVKEELQNKLGDNWTVKTQFEKNDLIYKTSRTEKLIVVAILIFVFIIAAFNLMTALVMSILEKKKDIYTMYSFGVTKKMMFQIFFYNGMMVALKGIILGLLLGYSICFAQLYFGLVKIPNITNDIFPIQTNLIDGLLILGIVLSLSFIATYIPVKYLLNRVEK
jgi:lipoprotein-releasing system permease protein